MCNASKHAITSLFQNIIYGPGDLDVVINCDVYFNIQFFNLCLTLLATMLNDQLIPRVASV